MNCGLRIADCGLWCQLILRLKNPQSEICNPQSLHDPGFIEARVFDRL